MAGADDDREWRTRWSLGVLHFLVIAAFTWARIVRDGVLLSRLPVEWVPWLTVAVLVATAAATPLIARISRRRSASLAFAHVAIITGVTLFGWQLLLRSRSTWSAVALYVWVGAYGPLLVAQFWLVVHASLDAERARRHISWVGAAGILGGVASGLAATLLTQWIGFEDLLGLTAMAHLAVGALALGRVDATPVAPEQVARQEAASVQARGVLREDGYARLLALVIVIGALTGGLVDYQFKLVLQRQTTDAAALGQWLGLFNVAASGLALCAQLATGLLLAKFGSRVLAVVLPAGVMAAAVAGLAMPGVWPPVAARLWETASRHSVTRTALEFFFFPFQGERRTTMKHAAEGFLTRGGEVGASVLLVTMAAVGRADSWHLSLAVALACIAWMFFLGWLGKAYGPALSHSLDALLRPAGRALPEVDVDRALAVPELVGLLRSRDPRHVVFALDELTSIDPSRARREAQALLAHDAPAVRARARTETKPRRATPPAALEAWAGATGLMAALKSADVDKAASACSDVVAARQRHAVPVLLASLSGPVRALARDTLVQLGDAVAGSLGDTLADSRVPLRVRRDVALVLGRIATPAALAELWRVPRTASHSLRSLALRGLDAAHKAGIGLAFDEAVLREDLRGDLEEHQQRRDQAMALGAPPADDVAILARALDEAASNARERVFRRLALIYPAREMLRAHRGLTSTEDRIRAFALEYLEATLTPDDRDLLLPVLRSASTEASPPIDGLIASLAADEDAWIATLAVYALGMRRDPSLRELAPQSPHDDAIHLETMRWALARL